MTDSINPDRDERCFCGSTLRLTVAEDGSITRIAGGPLEESIDTRAESREGAGLDVERLARAMAEDDDFSLGDASEYRAEAERIAAEYVAAP